MNYEEAKDRLITVRDLLRFAVSRFNQANLFFGHGTTNAFDEAAYLILHTLHLPLDRLAPVFRIAKDGWNRPDGRSAAGREGTGTVQSRTIDTDGPAVSPPGREPA